MKQVNRNDLLNLWLNKYHNTSVEELINVHSKEELSSPNWFKIYPCTKEQSAEWEKEAKKYILEKIKISKKLLNKEWGMIYLDCAPYVKPLNK